MYGYGYKHKPTHCSIHKKVKLVHGDLLLCPKCQPKAVLKQDILALVSQAKAETNQREPRWHADDWQPPDLAAYPFGETATQYRRLLVQWWAMPPGE